MPIASDLQGIANSVWSNRFIIAAIVQGAIITGLTLVIVAAQMLTSGTNIIQFLSLSFEGPAKWFFLGYIFYLILVVAIAVTAVFYNHLEVDMGRQIRGFRSVLAWIHFVGMNLGGAATTIAMVFAGLAGSGVLGVILGSDSLQPNAAIMEPFVPIIAAFTGLLSIGVFAGGLAYITTYLRKN
ncbi:MAG TPA: hypothetical protein VGQ13_08255 [Nitrososphaera sp.]|jgi:hypothetical protein|nr:hypothetical protein [Nitrososphaera sp.]